MEQGKYNLVLGAGLFLLLIGIAAGQDVQQTQPASPTSATSQAQAEVATFQAEQQALAQSFAALMTQRPTPQQMQAWHEQNATRLAAQRQRTMDMAADSALEPQPQPGPPNIPANASSTLKDFLNTQTTLANARAQIHNQLLAALPEQVSEAQIDQMRLSEEQLFHQQQAATLQLQAQRAQALAAESAQQPVPLPPPLPVPPGATPRMAAYLTARDQLTRDEINFSNQYVTASPAVRDAAMLQWRQQNASRFQQMQALAQNLSSTN